MKNEICFKIYRIEKHRILVEIPFVAPEESSNFVDVGEVEFI